MILEGIFAVVGGQAARHSIRSRYGPGRCLGTSGGEYGDLYLIVEGVGQAWSAI
jgi:hypothetical protein